MVHRSTLGALALASLLVLAGCTGLAAPNDANEQRPDPANNVTVKLDDGGPDGSTVGVGGRATVTGEPDAATVRLQVVARGDEPEVVRDRLSRNASAARSALLDYGLAEDQVRSDAFRIRENYRARREDEDAPAFVGVHELVVELDDVEAVGDVIDAAVESGPVRVEGVRFELSDERREALRDEALTAAVEDARSEAELVASAEDLELQTAQRIATDRVRVDEPSGTVVREAAATATPSADSGASTRVEAGEVTVHASVTVVYNASTTGG